MKLKKGTTLTTEQYELHYKIKQVAEAMGVIKPEIVYWRGWQLEGGGRDEQGWPLVWSVAEQLGIYLGCGGHHTACIDPMRYKEVPDD